MGIKVPVPNELQAYLWKKKKKELGLKLNNFFFSHFIVKERKCGYCHWCKRRNCL